MQISVAEHQKLEGTLSALRSDRLPMWQLFRTLADYYLPRRYVWLLSDKERRVREARNPMILDGTGTKSARTLASGMMNGITSPSRPWFKVRVVGFDDDAENDEAGQEAERHQRHLAVDVGQGLVEARLRLLLALFVLGVAAAVPSRFAMRIPVTRSPSMLTTTVSPTRAARPAGPRRNNRRGCV